VIYLLFNFRGAKSVFFFFQISHVVPKAVISDKRIWLAHRKRKLNLWRLPKIKRFYRRVKCHSLWPSYIREKGRTLGKTYGIKVRCYWEHAWEPRKHIGNLMKTWREHVGNQGKMKKVLPKWWNFTTKKKKPTLDYQFHPILFLKHHPPVMHKSRFLSCPIWQLHNIVRQGKLFVRRLHTTSFISQSSKKVCSICHVEISQTMAPSTTLLTPLKSSQWLQVQWGVFLMFRPILSGFRHIL